MCFYELISFLTLRTHNEHNRMSQIMCLRPEISLDIFVVATCAIVDRAAYAIRPKYVRPHSYR